MSEQTEVKQTIPAGVTQTGYIAT